MLPVEHENEQLKLQIATQAMQSSEANQEREKTEDEMRFLKNRIVDLQKNVDDENSKNQLSIHASGCRRMWMMRIVRIIMWMFAGECGR
jgi:hypothetical protein